MPEQTRQPLAKIKLNEPQSLCIDGLRAVAVLMVIVLHYKGVFVGTKGLLSVLTTPGAGGVFMFFVLSGLCITLSKSERSTWSAFFIRRAFRLVPACWLCMGLVLLMQRTVFNRPTNATELLGLLTITPNYFESIRGLNPVLWSLHTEIELYILFPIAIYAFVKLDRRSFLLVVWGVTLFSYLIWYSRQSIFNYYPPFPGIASWGVWILGMLLAFDKDLDPATSKPNPRLLWYAIVFLAVGSATLLARNGLTSNFFAFWYFLDGVGFYFLIKWALTSRPAWMQTRPMVWIGRRSYSLYLYHMPVSVFVIEYMTASLVSFCVTSAVLVIISECSYHFVEQPFIRLAKSLTNKSRTKRDIESEIVTAP